jgi:pimeloyl-ACP methyl ester carboxylesterase
VFWGAGGLLAVVLAGPAMTHAKAAGVLLRLSDGSGDPLGLREFATVSIHRIALSIDTVRAYRYEPSVGPGRCGVVLVHGVHYLGIDEPRLVRFAESLAETGLTVFTPQVASLADYRVDWAAVAEIGTAVRALRAQLGGPEPVGVVGISFAGSLALLAASDPEVGRDIGFVVTVGSYDDLARVSRFYATGTIVDPDGVTRSLRPHEYGPVVWVYSHLEDFFPVEGLEDVRGALRHWLHDEHDEARAAAARLASASKVKLEALFAGEMNRAVPDLLADIDRHASDLASLSPHDHLKGIHVPVFALHGSDDRLIPPSETLWIARDLPRGTLSRMLVSGALTHVEIGDQASLGERWRVVHFMAGVLAATHL